MHFSNQLFDKLRSSLIVAGLVLSPTVWAQVSVGETTVSPSVELQYFSDSNVFLESEDEQSGSGFRIAPQLLWTADYRTTELSARYDGLYSRGDVTTMDFEEHSLRFGGSTEFTKRARLSGFLSFNSENQTGASTLRLGANREFVLTANSVTLSTEFGYGAKDARGNVRAGLFISDRSFSDDADVETRSGYITVRPYAVLSIRAGGSTRVFGQIEYQTVDYDFGNSDREQVNAYLGVRWNESSIFGASAQVGLLSYQFPDASARDGEDFGAILEGFYKPADHSTLNFRLARLIYDDPDQLNLNEASVLDELSIAWLYDWSSRVSHTLAYSVDVVERDCSSQNQLDSELDFKMGVKVRSWIELGAGAAMRARDFDGCAQAVDANEDFNFTREQFTLFAKFSLN